MILQSALAPASAGASTPNMQAVFHSCCWKQLVLRLMLETPNTQAQLVFVLLSFPMTLSIADSIQCCNTLQAHLAGVGQCDPCIQQPVTSEFDTAGF